MTKLLFINRQWEPTASYFILLFSLLNTALFNTALYYFLDSKLDLYSSSGFVIAACVFVVVFIFNTSFLSLILLVIPILSKPFLVITTLINSVALYYMMAYQVVLDKTMMGNIFNTRVSEAYELITPTLFIYFLVFGLMPSLLLLRIKIRQINRLRVFVNLMFVFILGTSFLYINASSWLWIDKYSKILGGKILPWSYIINTARYYSEHSRSTKNQILLPKGVFANDKKIAVVLVIGETARVHNFSLYNYSRPTNPLLKTKNLLFFNETTACSTYTTASVACILSHHQSSDNYETLPSYLTRLGADVIWRTNNWGEPPIHTTEYQKSADLKKNCYGLGCNFDEVLLTGLKQRIQSSDKQKILVVLHTKGSHGSSYYSRYPAKFEKFTPVCRYEEISKCTLKELINAYDNTILYTDYLLYETIKELEQLNDIATMLVYISDHGESLGEQGLFLHGIPYIFAPKYQTKIPFIIWRSKQLIKLQAIANKDINQSGEFSHANIFHTIVGTLGLETKAYNRYLDVLH